MYSVKNSLFAGLLLYNSQAEFIHSADVINEMNISTNVT